MAPICDVVRSFGLIQGRKILLLPEEGWAVANAATIGLAFGRISTTSNSMPTRLNHRDELEINLLALIVVNALFAWKR